MPMTITQALVAEHVVFHDLFDTFERIIPDLKTLREVHVLAKVLESTLLAHAKVEDALIIEPLEHCFAQVGQQETFHQEHEEIDASLRRCVQCRDAAKARRLLLQAVVASRTHFDKEERLVFPMAERFLKTQTLASLGERWREQRKAIVG